MSDTQQPTARLPTGTPPERARDVRARAWLYVFQCWQNKQIAARPGGPDDAEEIENDRTATRKYTG